MQTILKLKSDGALLLLTAALLAGCVLNVLLVGAWLAVSAPAGPSSLRAGWPAAGGAQSAEARRLRMAAR
jgi:hypothetical protein